MPAYLVLFSLGVIAVSFFPLLPPLHALWCLPIFIALIIRYTRALWLIALLFGVGWGIYAGHQLVAMQLEESLVSKEINVIGVISDLPEQTHQRLRFTMKVRAANSRLHDDLVMQGFPRKIQLSWYNAYGKDKDEPLPELTVGQAWKLTVKLKRPRGFANPGGFDYQAWLLRQGIGATGYVVQSANNGLVEIDPAALTWREWIDQQRQLLQRWILKNSDSYERGILIALLIGDSAHVEKEQWNRMQKTGTSHLIAISGLHVGFLALFGFFLGLIVGKCVQLLWRSCPAFFIAWVTAILCAAFYSALAGFNIPTVRTLIMLSVFYLACLWQRNVRIADIFCCALALMVIIDPLAAYDMGFWLSFGAVALLLFYFSGRWVAKTDAAFWGGMTWQNLLVGFIRSQWVMFIGLLIPLSVLVSSVSLVAPLANAVAIPVITFVVVPLLLIGAGLQSLFPLVSNGLLTFAGFTLEWLKIFLQFLLDVAGDYASPIVAFSPSLALLIALSCLVLLLPKGLLHRSLGWCGLAAGFLMAYMLEQPNVPDLKITAMDVGQGTSVVVQVRGQTLVYDTGPKYTDSFDAGGAILAPYLYAQAINEVDALVVSHSDMDHAGGLTGFLEKVKAKQIITGDPAISSAHKNFSEIQNCHEKKSWQWHQVSFEFLPVIITPRTTDNNKSCVLLIRYQDQTILLPGDIETRVEHQLLADKKFPGNLTLVFAAHHGSRTSSGPRFVRHVSPDFVVYSAGFRSQHGHPHPQVRRRYESAGSREFNTADSGAIVFSWYENNNAPVISEQRKQEQRYWFD